MHSIQELIDIALKEDIGSGDVTTEGIIDPQIEGKGQIIAKEPLILAGVGVAKSVFAALGPQVAFSHERADGEALVPGDVILAIHGRLRCLLTGERTALNFLRHLSGVATLTREYVDSVSDKKVTLVDTRKTLPGFRQLEKYAVRIGGAENHRMGLYDGVLIKDNHIAACGGIAKAVDAMRRRAHHLLKIEVEVSTQAEVKEALCAGVDIIMLDNMKLEEIEAAVEEAGGKAVLEISGNVTKAELGRLAETGVDLISIGALTHSARSVDISMQVAQAAS